MNLGNRNIGIFQKNNMFKGIIDFNIILKRKFGRLTVIAKVEKIDGVKYVYCKCDCNNEKILLMRQSSITSGNTKSCGCLAKENKAIIRKTHGMSKSPEYENWCGMHKRCYNKNNKDWENYGGKGIIVCQRFHLFKEFYNDMGNRPIGLNSIDRINNNLNYSCGKCEECLKNKLGMNIRWANDKIQSRNKSNNLLLTINNETKILQDWCIYFNIDIKNVSQRINKYGWNAEKALKTPIRNIKLKNL